MSVKLGIYEHYKGKRYKVIGIAKHSETLEELVVYKALYGENQLWVRPIKMFTEEVGVADKKVPRFKYIEEDQLLNKLAEKRDVKTVRFLSHKKAWPK